MKEQFATNIKSEKGHIDSWGAVLLIAVTAFAGWVATQSGKDIIDHYNETRPTPTPTPTNSIESFENSFNLSETKKA